MENAGREAAVERFGRRVVAGAWIALALALFAPLVAAITIAPEDIDSGRIALTPPCAIQQRTGAPCATCGLTRAFSAIGHGRLDDARRYHRAALGIFAASVIAAVLAATMSVRAVRFAGAPLA